MHSPSKWPAVLAAGIATSIPLASAGFSSGASNQIALYWGQNSYGQAGSQQRLSSYCQNADVDIIPLAFMNQIKNPGVNFASAGDRCTVFAGTQLLSCPEIESDIQTCQQTYGKTILISLGGATYTEGGFSSASEATNVANTVWSMFGPKTSNSVNRPFGNAVVDGIDFDFESSTQNMQPFAAQLRKLMDASTASTGKKYYLSAAPQCFYPDAADQDMLNGGVAFDMLLIQFYNNDCGVNHFVPGASSQPKFNYDVWDNWAKTISANRNVKLFLGIPGNVGAGGGYTSGSALQSAIAYCKQFSTFGGVMIWDASQTYANSGFLNSVVSYLGGSTSPPPTSTQATTTAKPTSTTTFVTSTKTSTTTSPPGGTLVPQWGQCGGQDYTGPTQCAPPYTCVATGPWWSQCQ